MRFGHVQSVGGGLYASGARSSRVCSPLSRTSTVANEAALLERSRCRWPIAYSFDKIAVYVALAAKSYLGIVRLITGATHCPWVRHQPSLYSILTTYRFFRNKPRTGTLTWISAPEGTDSQVPRLWRGGASWTPSKEEQAKRTETWTR